MYIHLNLFILLLLRDLKLLCVLFFFLKFLIKKLLCVFFISINHFQVISKYYLFALLEFFLTFDLKEIFKHLTNDVGIHVFSVFGFRNKRCNPEQLSKNREMSLIHDILKSSSKSLGEIQPKIAKRFSVFKFYQKVDLSPTFDQLQVCSSMVPKRWDSGRGTKEQHRHPQ